MHAMFLPSFFELASVFVMVFASTGAISVPSGVPPLPEDPALLSAAPSESLLFVEWFGMGTADPKSKNATERLAANEEIRALVTGAVDAVQRALLREAGRRERPLVREGLDLLRLVATRPGCVFVSDVVLPPRRPAVSGGIVVHAGERAGDARRALGEIEGFLLEEMSGGRQESEVPTRTIDGATFRVLPLPPDAPPVAWGVSGEYVILAVGPGMPEKILKGLKSKAGLAASEAFKKLHAAVKVERPSSRTYVDIAQLLEKVGPLGGPQASAVIEALGISNVTALVSETGLEGEGFVARSLVAVRGKGTGLLRLAEGAPLADADLAVIPRDATLAAVCRFDLEDAYKEFLSILGSIDRRAKDEFLSEVPEEIEEELGIDLVADLMRPLGDCWCAWNSPGQGGLVITGLTAAVSVDDPDRLARTLDRIVDLMRGELGPRRAFGSRSRRGVFIDSFTFQGTKIYYLNSVGEEMPVAPAWCLTRKHLLVSLFPQMLKATLARGLDVETSLARHAAIQDRGDVLALWSLDAPDLFRTIYPLLHPLAQLACSELQREGINITIAALPSAGGILPNLKREVATVARTDQGILMVSRGVIPNASPLAGLVLPSLVVPLGFHARATSARASSARDTAVMAERQSELHMMYQALQMYKAENGSYPDSLDALWSGEHKYVRRQPQALSRGKYEYFKDAGAQDVLLAAPVSRQGRRGVLYGSGRVAMMPEFQYQQRSIKAGRGESRRK